MRTTDIHIDEGALSLCRLLLRATEAVELPTPPTLPSDNKYSTVWERLDGWFSHLRQRDRERYLAQSRDIFELESRIRRLERRPYY